MVLRRPPPWSSDYSRDLLDFTVLARPVVAYVPDLDEVRRRIPGSSTTSPTWWPGRSVATGPSCSTAWEHLLAEPTDDQVAELREGAGPAALLRRRAQRRPRVVRRVQATYLPDQAWFAPNL